MKPLKNVNTESIKFGFYAKYIKRPMDFVLALLTILILSPLFLIISILVLINIGKPVFFKQVRCGKDEVPFEMIKFKTMRDIRDEQGHLLPDSERLSKMGNFLRNTSLDELPELFNVLKGDMSIIGPRPLYTFYVPYYTEEEALRHAVRVGITGLAQVNGRALCHWNQRFAFDVEYVRNITFSKDLSIIIQTFAKVFKRADIGEAGVDDEEALHIIREVQRPDRLEILNDENKTKDGTVNIPVFEGAEKK